MSNEYERRVSVAIRDDGTVTSRFVSLHTTCIVDKSTKRHYHGRRLSRPSSTYEQTTSKPPP
ncbi:hypothetical protein C8Q74DRAFT_1301015 [Fomes fomentarius]|nr:hypothetical protein C8Q74DRAFT_1301015 [Fomes fomentarius]